MIKNKLIDSSKKNYSFNRGDLAVVAIMFATAVLITFVSVFLLVKDVKAAISHYPTLILTVLSIFALLITAYFCVKRYSKRSLNLGRNVAISTTTIVISVIVSVILSVYVNKMSLVLLLAVMLVAITVDIHVSIYINVVTSLIYLVLLVSEAKITGGNIAYSSLVAVLMSILTGIFMTNLLRKNYTRYKMIAGSVFYVIIASVTVIPFSVIYSTDYKEILMNGAWFLVGSLIAIALYTVLLPIYENVFKVWTDFKLAEVASFSHPLLLRLREEAPGTFNHSLVVGNLAESCAMAIGEDPYLARVAAYYHDVGKLKNPKMFVENQDASYNPHDELIPEVSARMITRHAKEGYNLLKKNNMPEEIARIAVEHHGTSAVKFFYMKAQRITEGILSMSKYRYDGPKPSSKISAIIMICDTIEAAVRSRQPAGEEELRAFVKAMIKDKIDMNQFDESNITFEDLGIIEEEIVKTIPSIYHHRIDYSKEKK